MISFSLDGAIEAKKIISESYEYVLTALMKSEEVKNSLEAKIWLKRVTHLISELNWIDNEILKLEAAEDGTTGRFLREIR